MIQVAQIGCGRIARDSEFKGILRNSDVARIVAVCDLDTVRMADAKNLLEQAYAKKFGTGKYAALKTYGDYREMPRTRASMRSASARPITGTRNPLWKRRWPEKTSISRSPLR